MFLSCSRALRRHPPGSQAFHASRIEPSDLASCTHTYTHTHTHIAPISVQSSRYSPSSLSTMDQPTQDHRHQPQHQPQGVVLPSIDKLTQGLDHQQSSPSQQSSSFDPTRDSGNWSMQSQQSKRTSPSTSFVPLLLTCCSTRLVCCLGRHEPTSSHYPERSCR